MVDEKRLYKVLGERLRGRRENGPAGRLTQAQVAEAVGLERTSITNTESGAQKLSLHMLYRVCDALQVSINDVLPPADEVRSAITETPRAYVAGFAEPVTPLVKEKLDTLINRVADGTR